MPETTEITTDDANSTVRRRVYGGLYNDVDSAEVGVRRFRDAGYPGERIVNVSHDSPIHGE